MLNPVPPMLFAVFKIKRLFLKMKKRGYLEINNLAKNVPKICIKLCAAGIFGCRICICSI